MAYRNYCGAPLYFADFYIESQYPLPVEQNVQIVESAVCYYVFKLVNKDVGVDLQVLKIFMILNLKSNRVLQLFMGMTKVVQFDLKYN